MEQSELFEIDKCFSRRISTIQDISWPQAFGGVSPSQLSKLIEGN